jgi:hypothetical protein
VPRQDLVYITWIIFPPGMAAKLSSKHGLSVSEVRDTFELPNSPQRGTWNEHPEYGVRLFVEGLSSRGVRLLAILAPTDEPDVWILRTAWGIANR